MGRDFKGQETRHSGVMEQLAHNEFSRPLGFSAPTQPGLSLCSAKNSGVAAPFYGVILNQSGGPA
jgi:hypothetical protein